MKLKAAYKKSVLSDAPLRWARQTLANRRTSVRQGVYPSEKVMRQTLLSLGWKVVQEEQWGKSVKP